MWEPQPLTTLGASKACRVENFTFIIYLWLCGPLLDCCFSFLILYTVGRTPWTGDQPVTRLLPAHRTAQTQSKRTQTFMPQVGFEPPIPAFKQMKTVHALECTATLTSFLKTYDPQNHLSEISGLSSSCLKEISARLYQTNEHCF
jgi:hypothetical protein